jgi:hypothetical protein
MMDLTARTLARWVVFTTVIAVATACPLHGAQGAIQGQRRAVPVPTETPAQPIEDQDAERTREELARILARYPPGLGRVLKLDPTLLTSDEYLSSYPVLAGFLSRHPEIARNPGYYFARVPGPDAGWLPPTAESLQIGMWNDFFEGIGAFAIFLTVTGTLAWLIKTLIDWRRWNRVFRVQSEVHSKLLDRFTASEDVIKYIQTPAGRRFLESGPVLAETGQRSFSAPISRMLWSVQAGVVLVMLGFGFQYISRRVALDASQPMFALGVLALALGLGFVASAAVAFLLTRRMGLLEPPPVIPSRSDTPVV